MQLIIDLDGTICTEEKQFSRALARPLPDAVESIRALKEGGHTIIIYSARTWAEFEVTVEWLKNHGVLYDQLILGKPQGDYWIDDRAISHDAWAKTLRKLL